MRTAALAFGLGAALACTPAPPPPAFQDQAVEETEFRIAPSDVLVIRVWRSPEMSAEAPVLPDGTVTVPLVGAVPARGLTTTELEDAIAERLTDYITAPEVSVIVNQVNSKRVSVVGEVGRSGYVSIGTNTRVVEAISSAGGFSSFANRARVKIIRQTDQGEVEYRFNYDAYVGDGWYGLFGVDARGTNVKLQPGDVIVVPD
jgi:polysaccharide export outer membrane protein